MEKTKINNEYEYDKSYVIHSLFEDYPIIIRFAKKKSKKLECSQNCMRNLVYFA